MEITAESPSRRSSASSSPEFEFWMLRNPPSSNPQPPLLSADEMFADGVILPLQTLSLTPTPTPHLSLPSPPLPQPPRPEDPPPSKKWKDIFKPGEKKPADKKDRKAPSPTGNAAAEINIHIWPFSRSRSSGNGRPRATATATARKASSAPCSRSNSSGESSKHAAGGGGVAMAAAAVRKLTPSPGRAGGIYLGRNNPVWQLRRRAGRKKDVNGGAGGVGRVINLNVNTCIGHQRPANCRDCEEAEAISDDRSGDCSGGNGEGGAGGDVNRSLFNLRAIFTRKVY